MDLVTVKVYKADLLAKLPYRASEEAAGWDLYSVEDKEIWPGGQISISTGLVIQPLIGYHIKIYARSGWGNAYGIGIPHGVGIIDRDFSGPEDIIKVILTRSVNTDNDRVLYIKKGDRIAQMIIEKSYE